MSNNTNTNTNTNAYRTLDDLLDAIVTGRQDLHPGLPTFGGVEPSDTAHIWSWDEHRLLVDDLCGSGADGRNVKIIDR